jgi:hypothetical protein
MTDDPVATLTALAAWERQMVREWKGSNRAISNYHAAQAKHIDGVIARHKRASAGKHYDWSTDSDVRELLAVAEALKVTAAPASCDCHGGPHGGYTCPDCQGVQS